MYLHALCIVYFSVYVPLMAVKIWRVKLKWTKLLSGNVSGH